MHKNVCNTQILYFMIQNVTLIGEVKEEYHNYFSLDVLYETSAGADHYLTLVHSCHMVNGTVMITE